MRKVQRPCGVCQVCGSPVSVLRKLASQWLVVSHVRIDFSLGAGQRVVAVNGQDTRMVLEGTSRQSRRSYYTFKPHTCMLLTLNYDTR